MSCLIFSFFPFCYVLSWLDGKDSTDVKGSAFRRTFAKSRSPQEHKAFWRALSMATRCYSETPPSIPPPPPPTTTNHLIPAYIAPPQAQTNTPPSQRRLPPHPLRIHPPLPLPLSILHHHQSQSHPCATNNPPPHRRMDPQHSHRLQPPTARTPHRALDLVPQTRPDSLRPPQ